MARKRKTGDTAYNARRREYRAAQRYLKAAQQTTGATAEKNRALAQAHLQNAINTYDPTQKQNISAPIRNLAAEFGMTEFDISKQRATTTQKKQTRAIQQSQTALASVPLETRREQEADILMANPSISKRIIGGLVDVWRDKVKSGVSAEENREKIKSAIFDYFKISSWADLLDKLVGKLGDLIFSTKGEEEIYDTVKLSLQIAIERNAL